ncbi:hypothetical protein L195_g024970 [Trifolium pratense]|uniref:Uncharacterized protein n=1 Tax=Trifolium pratense TaxID=57577 RepID=A0A2K3NF77_TRIPR|nr:hypothetical protein L195_g024970 [Trifolium pratense]
MQFQCDYFITSLVIGKARVPIIKFVGKKSGLMQVEPVTASGLIRASPLPNATAAEPGEAQTYSAAVNWKRTIKM